MTLRRPRRRRIAFALSSVPIGAGTSALAQSAWRPDQRVEVVVPTGPDGVNDQNARLLQKALAEQKLAPTAALAMNAPGAMFAVMAHLALAR